MLARLVPAYLLLLSASAHVEEQDGHIPTAVDVDDECGLVGLENTDGCAINALQRRMDKATVLSTSKDNSLGHHPVVSLELFRPMNSKDAFHELTNVDMFSIQGVLHYLHTQVVWEHKDDEAGTAEPRMRTRAEDFDLIVGVDAKVRNPDSVIAEVGEVDKFVDFADVALFVDGMATGPGYNWDYGDIVGAITSYDKAYPTINPYYRFSLSGYCPNLQFQYKHHQSNQTGSCVKYSDRYGLPAGEILRGGLCPNGTDPGVMPTGAPGCSYTYTTPQPQNITALDDLVGITEEDCGGRKCKNWRDFRSHCSNHKHKVKFNYVEGSRRRTSRYSRRRHYASLAETESSSEYSTLVRTNFCVEYDVHKACSKSCFAPECLKIPAHQREVGLPFWKGRCDPVRNAQRAEKLALALGITHATKEHKLQRTPHYETCLSSDPEALCHPNPETGGMYCSRHIGGVCQPCYIPGTVEPYAGDKSTPTCPWDILRTGQDYTNPAMHPKCASNLPRDYCCLYTNTCDTALLEEAMNATKEATDDGFAYVSSLENTETMEAFLQRAVKQSADIDTSAVAGFTEFAYWEWVGRPIPGATLERAVGAVQQHQKHAK